MRLATGAALFGMLTGCAAAPILDRPNHGAWQPMGYAGFSESIDALVGSTAIDCGFLNMLDTKTTDAMKRRASDCVQAAMSGGQPFKFGTVRVPIDSYAYEVLARSSTGELWQITYDQMLLEEDGAQQWNKVCKSATLERGTLFLTGL